MGPYSPAFRALLLASATVTPLAAAEAQTAPSPTTQSSTADAIRVLLDQANYWRSKDEPQRADEALGRVLALDPRNPDALAAQAQAAAERGNQQVAMAALAKLQAARPGDPRIDSIQQVLRAGPLDNAALSEARRLAQAGKPADAVAAYRRAFKGSSPPPSLAAEYYQTLASTDGNWDAARDGLASQVRTNPQDLRTQLAYAQALTYHEGTRADGVDRLAALSKLPSIGQQATVAWRQALLWSSDDDRTQGQLNAYLSRNPTDADLDAKKTELTRTIPDPGIRSRLSGYNALEGKQTADAERNFNAALAYNPNDVDSLAMLALIRKQQGRMPDARRLIDKAVSLAPDRREELLSAVGLDAAALASGNRSGNPGASGGGDGGLAIRRDYAQVAALTRRGEYAEAETKLRRLMGNRPNLGNYLQLGDLQARAGKLADAEASFRTVLRSQPRNVAALSGLGNVLTREGKEDEAQQIFARAGVQGGGQSRAAQLANQAKAATDSAARIALLRSAVADAPADPWLRLELARNLLAQNQAADARQVMAPVTGAAKPTVEQLRAGIYFADNSHDWPLVGSLVEKLPPAARTGDMRTLAVRADASNDLREAQSQGGPAAEAQRLVALAAKPDPTGVRGTVFAQELIKLGDKRDAREVIRVALNASRPPLPQQRIAYGGMLIAAGYPRDAQVVTGGLQGDRLNPLERSNLAEVRDNAAVFSSDRLAGRGNTADAYDELAPRLAQNPENPDLNMALARLYEAHRQPSKAVAITEELLKRNPSSLSVRVAAINAALAAGDTGRAAELAGQTKEEFSDDPQAWLASANVARARGLNGEALSDLRTARSLRTKQLDTTDSSDASSVMPEGWLSGRQYALNIVGDVANDASPTPISAVGRAEPVTREYERYAQYLPATSLDDPRPAPSTRIAQSDTAAPLLAPPASPTAPIQLSQGLAADGGAVSYGNPFRSTPSPTLDEPNATPGGILGLHGNAVPQRPADPLTADIDRSIEQVSADVAPRLDGSLVFRGRSGDAGLGELFSLEAPLEASFSPAGYGRLKVQVTPTALFAGQISQANEALFGNNPLAPAGTTFRKSRDQNAYGTGLDVGYAYDFVSADIGTSPIGFRDSQVIGGITFAPRISNELTVRVLGERRSVTDSLLSYAGQRDPLTGQSWGGVTRNRGHLQFEGTVGNVSYYAGAGAGVLVGDHVKSNTEVEAGAGLSFPVWTTPTQEVRTGLDLVYFGFDRNLNNFTFGSGGYFSPQQFFAALFPVNYKEQVTPDLSYSVGGSIGVQTFRAKSALVFPNDPDRQSALNALASSNSNTVTRIAGFKDTGVAGGAHADVDYRVTNNLHIGARAGFDKSGNFTEGTGLVYARYVFNNPL